jgi:c-di-GMP-binding flagellar brake protein YcgR
MDKSSGAFENRRSNMRTKAKLDFCVSFITEYSEDGANDSRCFCTSTIDLSVGGMCITHKGNLEVGDLLEFYTPKTLKMKKCLSCEHSYLMDNELELAPIQGKVVWASDRLCGIKFLSLSVRNENIISKFVWDKHLTQVRTHRNKVSKA